MSNSAFTRSSLAVPVSVANGGTGVTSSTGTGSAVLNTSPSLVTPILGVAAATSMNFGVSALSYYGQSAAWTPTPTSLTVVGTPTYTGTYTRIGNMVFCSLGIASTVTTAATAGTTYFTGIPFTPAFDAGTVIAFNDGAATTINGTGGVYSGNQRVYVPTWSAASNIQVNFWYLV